ncbi:hypothetical protein EEB14_52220 [Rhodococcus sp. WS4]|nr:hypothetical protein EEB14_52220 [Rhodococcus sp. WS4]
MLVTSVASVAVPLALSRRAVAGGMPATPRLSTTSLSLIADGIGGSDQQTPSPPRPVLTQEQTLGPCGRPLRA